ncbi:MAG TPA: hypothetical protein V6D26_14195 [Stenomitos sp.]
MTTPTHGAQRLCCLGGEMGREEKMQGSHHTQRGGVRLNRAEMRSLKSKRLSLMMD